MVMRRRRYLLVAVPLTLVALLASGCSSEVVNSGIASFAPVATPRSASPAPATGKAVATSAPKPASLVGTTWQLTAYASTTGAMTKATTAPSAGILEFAAGGKLSGSTGCNSFSGTYKLSGSSLTIEVGPVTMMACSGAAATQENAVLANLALVDTFTIGSRLQLKMESSTVLSYTAGMTGLSGSSWVATGINNGKGGVVSEGATSRVTAKFDSQGGISGSGGCNTYTAHYTTSARNGMKIGPTISTMMACEPTSIMTTEQQYFAALAKVASYQRDANRLTLMDSSGATQVTYIPAS